MENFVVFILDENGEYFSTDGQHRFRMLTGIEAYEYRFSEEGKQRKYADHTIGNCTVLFEVNSKSLKKFEPAESHSKYLQRWKAAIGYKEISTNTLVDGDQSQIELIDTIADPTTDVEEEAIRNIEVTALQNAVSHLSPQERCLIHCLFLSESPVSGRIYGKIMGIPQKTISNRIHTIFEKLKNFL